jgi:hypothetical protein
LIKRNIVKITHRQLRQLIREALDTKLSRHRSKGSLPDARSDEKAAARRSQRRYDSKAIEAGLSDFADELEDHSSDAVEADTHPHILSIRMVEALRPVIQSGNVAASLEGLDALWKHLRNTSPVPTNDVPENAPGDDIEWMENRFHLDQEDWPDEG